MSIKKIVLFFFFIYTTCGFSQLELVNFYNSKNGLSVEDVKHITQDKIGYLWLGTDKGLFKFDGNTFQKVNNRKITFLAHKDDKLYIGLENGLLVNDGNKDIFFECKTIKNILFFNDDIYAATKQGIYVLEKKYLKPLQITTKVDFSIIYDINYFKNNFYIASNKGLFKVDNLKKPTTIEHEIQEPIIDVEIINNKIVLATENDLATEYTVNNNSKVFNRSNKFIKLKNELWVISDDDGISRYSLPTYTFLQKLNKYNLITTNNVNTVFQSIKGIFWIATSEGLYQFENNNTNDITDKPNIYIENLFVNYEKRNDLAKKNNISLEPEENSISIQYKTIDFQQPKNIQYRYKINESFSNWSNNNSLQLANLAYGNYTITFQSKVNNKLSDVKTLNIEIATPIYYNVYFLICCLLVLLCVTYGIVQQRIKLINKKNTEKLEKLHLQNNLLKLKHKALQLQMNPHFIFNVLNNIKALGITNKKEELNRSITQFSSLLRSILHNSNKEEVSLEEEINAITNYLELEKLISSKPFDYTIDVNIAHINTEEIVIPSMLLQPFLENSIKHGFSVTKKGLIKVNIQEKNDHLSISIIDNGIGINASKAQKSNDKTNNSLALSITQKRLNSIYKYNNFDISEILEVEKVIGTKVSFTIPLKLDY